MPLPGRLHRRPAQQPAHGILFSRDYRQRCTASRVKNTASRCDVLRMELHAGGGRRSLVIGQKIVGQRDVCSTAAERRQNAVHGASRGSDAKRERAPEGRKSFGERENIALRMGLRYVRGLREEAGQALVRERLRVAFTSIHDLTRRVPELRKDELTTLAEIGALNAIGNPSRRHGSAKKNEKSGHGFPRMLTDSINNQRSTIDNHSS